MPLQLQHSRRKLCSRKLCNALKAMPMHKQLGRSTPDTRTTQLVDKAGQVQHIYRLVYQVSCIAAFHVVQMTKLSQSVTERTLPVTHKLTCCNQLADSWPLS